MGNDSSLLEFTEEHIDTIKAIKEEEKLLLEEIQILLEKLYNISNSSREDNYKAKDLINYINPLLEVIKWKGEIPEEHHGKFDEAIELVENFLQQTKFGSRKLYRGPRGGRYYKKGGRKVYV